MTNRDEERHTNRASEPGDAHRVQRQDDGEFTTLRREAGNATRAELVVVAEAHGWVGVGDDRYEHPGRPTLTIPAELAPGEAQTIIAALAAEDARGGE